MADSNGNGEVGVEILNRDPDPALEENSDDNNGAAELLAEMAEPEDENSMTDGGPLMNTSIESSEGIQSPDKAPNSTSDSESDASSDSKIPTKKRKKNNGNYTPGVLAIKHHATLRKTLDPFVQKKDCEKLKHNLGKCLECRQKNRVGRRVTSICRFLSFRKLRYTERGSMTVAGFPDSTCDDDYSEEDLSIWRFDNPPGVMTFDLAKFLLEEVGDQFCELVKQEKETLIQLQDQEDKMVIWRRVVQNLREMCDVCSTTLFNYHWTCGKCGFVVCVSCFNARRNKTAVQVTTPPENKDGYKWLKCRSNEHNLQMLMLTQIVAGKTLDNLWTKLHQLRTTLNIPSSCDCNSPQAFNYGNLHKKTAPLISPKKESLNNSTASKEANEPDDAESEDGGLMELMMGGDTETEKSEENVDSNDEEEDEQQGIMDLFVSSSNNEPEDSAEDEKNGNTADVITSTTNAVQPSSDDSSSQSNSELKNFVRKDKSSAYCIKVVPKQVMSLTKSKRAFPDVPHSWHCSGYLLRLADSTNPGNLQMFQEQWKRGQPVIVSGVGHKLSKDLWSPESFSRDFGSKSNNLINCMSNKVVPCQKMKKFWDGFEHAKQRLKDEKGDPMLLKLKDWPPGDDFAKLLPDRFDDLMSALPLGEYTRRDGILNLAARLPNVFCKPDLGPKMYIAYGSGWHLDQGTTNLHLDVSDAVNVMVHVGVVEGDDAEEHEKAVMKAIEESDCDVTMINRVRKGKELPGALWHIWEAADADKIRDMINKDNIERGIKVEQHHDAIHDQSVYLGSVLRKRLRDEYNVIGYPIIQCAGDAVFIPAGAPHQVRNFNNCIKVAEDFVSPENVGHCFHLTEEFRDLTETHTNHEDKLQIKNIVYHTVKDAVAVIDAHLAREESPKPTQ